MLHLICRIHSLKKTSSSHNLHKFPIFQSISLVSFSTSTPKISIFDYLVNQHQFPPDCASKVSSLSSTKYLNKPQNADFVLNFLKENGFSKNHIETLVQKAPWVLLAKLETSVKPKMEIFQELGIQSTELADIVSANPFLLRTSADRLQQSILGLKNILGPNGDVCRFLMNSSAGRFMTRRDLNRTLVPNVEYLKSRGVCSIQIGRYIYLAPVTFFAKPEKFKLIVERVDEMGVNRQSKLFLCAVKTISSMSRKSWEMKLKLFRELGFSEQNILYAFRVQPSAFSVSERKIKEVTQLLLSVDDFSISDIVCNPILLCYSVEKRLKPRLRVLKALQSKNLLKKRPRLVRFLRMTEAEFMKKYVIPYSDELGDMCVGSQGS